jgi:diguanylate cyclase (GGDEF)-like protein/PAS domain S-box-containing protein
MPFSTADIPGRLGIPDRSVQQLIVSAIDEGIVVQDTTGAVIWASARAGDILGLTVEQLTGLSSIDPRWRAITVDGLPLPGEAHPAMRTLATGEDLDHEVMGVDRPSGERRWIAVTTRVIRRGDDTMAGVVAMFVDITHQHESNRRFEAFLQAAPIGVAVVAPDGTIATTNPRVVEVCGMDPAGKNVLELVDVAAPEDLEIVRDGWERALHEDFATEADMEFRFPVRGSMRWLRVRAMPVRVGDRFEGAVTTVEDIHEARMMEEELRFRASHDWLTRLGNRTLIERRLHELKAWGPRSLAVLLIDLDGFKAVNDTLGHQAGDALLTHVAQRIVSACEPDDTVARLGGDEFAVLIPGVGTDVGETRAQAILAALSEPIVVGAALLTTQCSIGIAATDSLGIDSTGTQLFQRADEAMYRAKQEGKNRYAIAADAVPSGAGVTSAT